MPFFKLTVGAPLLLALCAFPGLADNILITGVGTGGGPAVNAGQFEEQGWTQTEDYTDVNISVALYSWTLSQPFHVQAYLTTSTDGVMTPLASTSFSDSTPDTNPVTYLLFSGLTLPTGTYYVTLAGTDSIGISPGAIWPYECPSGCPLAEDTGVSLLAQGFADNQGHGLLDSSTPYESTFIAGSAPVNLTVTGIPLLPEPGTMTMAAAALGLLTFLKRRR